ncbi:MAG TPA: thioredoxin family protein [Pyrinomonadaceae bacterium]|nr:thioredoxin family protein [Pyrinomonadaceae bacterium]
MEVCELNAGNYDSFVEANARVVIHFWAAWNLVDEQMTQPLTELTKTYGNSIAFASFDTSLDEHADICRKLKLLNLPALVLYKHGKHFETALGMGDTEGTLERFLASHC